MINMDSTGIIILKCRKNAATYLKEILDSSAER
jgi:hypothetical protein